MYGGLPNTGINLSTPVYLIVGLITLLAGLVVLTIDRLKAAKGNAG